MIKFIYQVIVVWIGLLQVQIYHGPQYHYPHPDNTKLLLRGMVQVEFIYQPILVKIGLILILLLLLVLLLLTRLLILLQYHYRHQVNTKLLLRVTKTFLYQQIMEQRGIQKVKQKLIIQFQYRHPDNIKLLFRQQIFFYQLILAIVGLLLTHQAIIGPQ